MPIQLIMKKMAVQTGAFKTRYKGKIDVIGLTINENSTDCNHARTIAVFGKLKSQGNMLM